ncbi:MAG: Keratan-sulfate endo-1,4-beta-galactosidase [Petrimonas sp.]|jgi:beta-glucanase (GH16 family)|uniref:glycoside hydrolase family 16 protein n=1 Tax=Petrimonas sp. TaxID=2023866 RepID=UPI0030CD2198
MKKTILRIMLIFILTTSLYSCGSIFEFPEEKIINISDNTNWKIIWEDNFDKDTIDYNFWSKTPRSKALWAKHMTNNDTCYEVKDGILILRGVVNNFIKNDPSPYLTGGIETIKKKNITYGKVEIKAKMNKVDTAWPAIWMKTEDRTWLGEIDIMETFDNYDKENLISQTVHSHYTINLGLKSSPNHTGVNMVNDKSEYNIYGVIINEKEVLFYVNNKITFTYPKTSTEEDGQYPYGDPKFLILSMQLGHTMEGRAPSIKELQPEMHVDWVRFYEKIDKTLPDY